MANSWNFKLQSFHNKLFRQFKFIKQNEKDALLLQQLLNWLYYDEEIQMNNNIANLLNNIVTEEKKQQIRLLCEEKGIKYTAATTIKKEQGDYAEQAVALLGQLLANINEGDLNLKLGVTGDQYRVLEIPTEISNNITKTLASKITSEKVGQNREDFVYTSPGQMKVDVDYSKIRVSVNLENDNALIQRLLSYKFSVKAYTSNTIDLEEINWQQALISVLSSIYSKRNAHRIALWYNNRILNGDFLVNDKLGKHIDHVVKLAALTGYGGFIVESPENLQRVTTAIPDFLVVNQIAQKKFYVISINQILDNLSKSDISITERASRHRNLKVAYNINTNFLRYN